MGPLAYATRARSWSASSGRPCAMCPGRRLRGMRTQLVGANLASLNPVPWSLPRPMKQLIGTVTPSLHQARAQIASATCARLWSAPTGRHYTMHLGRFHGPRTELVGTNNRLYTNRLRDPQTQLVGTIGPSLHFVPWSLSPPGRTQLFDAVWPPVRHVPQPPPRHAHASDTPVVSKGRHQQARPQRSSINPTSEQGDFDERKHPETQGSHE
eukprot:jgi/Tetstr1/457013/TSEL_043677.t1